MKLPKLRNNIVLLLLILAIGIGFRLRNWNLGVVDAHPMRQTDSECVAYYMAKGIGSLLYPKNCLIRPVSNTQGYFFLEFPVYEGLVAAGYKLIGVNSVVYRVINMALYLISGWGVYYFVKKLLDEKVALFSVLLFSLAPASIFFIGHAFHPDIFAVAMMVMSLSALMKFVEANNFASLQNPLVLRTTRLDSAKRAFPFKKRTTSILWLVMSGVLLGLSVATRPFGLIVAPVYGWILLKNKSKVWDYFIIGMLGIGIYGMWRWWVHQSGITADWENWVLSGRESFFDFDTLIRRLVWTNVSGQVIGRAISGLAALGSMIAIIKKNTKLLPIIWWILLIPAYWYIAFQGNLIHQYYGDIYILPIAILGAVGLGWVWQKSRVVALAVIALVMLNGYRTSDYYFNDRVPDYKLAYAKEIADNTEEDAKIVYMVKSDSTTLSLAHRQGWMLGEWPVDVSPTIPTMMEMKNFGMNYVVEPKDSWDIKREDMVVVAENYPLFKETDHLRIYKWEKK